MRLADMFDPHLPSASPLAVPANFAKQGLREPRSGVDRTASVADLSLPSRVRRTSRRTGFQLASIVSFGLLAAACSTASASESDGTVAGNGEVATMEDTIVAEVMEDEGTGSDASPEDAALAFSQCMRDEGLDFPDLSVDAEGNISLREAAQSFDPGDQSFQDAREVCQSELADGGFGGGRQEALESTEVQDALLAFSDCVRDEGFDVGDLTLGAGAGAGGQGDGAAGATQNGAVGQDGAEGDDQGDGDGPPEGRREGGFGDRNGRIAQQLGLDPEDPAVVEVLETCSPVLEEAFADAGLGQGQDG